MTDRRPTDCVLLSIHPDHASRIYAGEKRAELRKTFPAGARFVFLYETAPVSALTGGFMVHEAVRASVREAVELARAAGLDSGRAEQYYGQRANGWVVHVGLTLRFATPLPLSSLRDLDHYFTVPQAFGYLPRYEAITQTLLGRLLAASRQWIHLRQLEEGNRPNFESLVLTEVGEAYADIDRDFLDQVLDSELSRRRAFSTTRKVVLEARWGRETIGYTVVSSKSHGAWKTGPTILLAAFRGLGLGQVVRERIEEYCRARGARSLYCTCAENRPAVVAYLVNAGMSLQARLRSHLEPSRDELVFAKALTDRQSRPVRKLTTGLSGRLAVRRIKSGDTACAQAVRFFLTQMRYWYFRAPKALAAAIVDSLRIYEEGDRAYSSKGRMLLVVTGRADRLAAAALLTFKRSGMVKVNLVSASRHAKAVRMLVNAILQKTRDFRRVYLTLPASEETVLSTVVEAGLTFEGILSDPFGTGRDHVCFGLVRAKSVRRAPTRKA